MSPVNAPQWDAVPLGAAATFLARRPDLSDLAGAHLRMLGNRIEVDLTSLREAGQPEADLAQALGVYWAQCETLWAGLREQVPTGDYVLVRRALRDAAQSTTKGSRADLVAEMDALLACPQTADVVTDLTGAEPDCQALRQMVASCDGSVDCPDGGTTIVSVNLTGAVTLPEELGGVRWPGEVRRTIVMTARHAAWRDRRVRRLARVQVSVWEVWPDPEPARALLPARVLELAGAARP